MGMEDIAKKIYDRFIDDPAGFAVAFTNIFQEVDGTPQTLYPLQISFLNSKKKPGESIVTVVKCRQCLTGDSMIYTTNGPRPIKELLDEEYRGSVYTIDENGTNVIDDVCDIWGTGKKIVYEVKLASGERIKASKEHKIKTVDGWKKVEELSIGDVVVSFEGEFGSESLPKYEIITMGYFITDGSYSNSTPKFTNINLNYLREYEENVKNFGVNVSWKHKGNGYDLDVVGINGWGSNKPNPYSKYLMDLGLRGVKPEDRVLPSKFLSLNKQDTSLLLNRIFAGDGWYSSCGKNKTNEVGIGSPSLQFLYQISYLLSKYGIHASVYEVNSGKKQKNKFYKLKFSSNEYVEKFINEIDIFGKTPRSEITYSYKIHKSKNRITSIKEIGEEETYDLMTERYHSFIANGILVHNSGFSTSIKAKAIHHAYFGLVPNILIASASERQAQKIMTEIREHFESMPEWMRPNFGKNNATELHLESGSKIISLPANPQTVRGFTGMVFWDEAAAFSRKDSEKFFSAIYPSVSKGYQLILVSTPDGKDNKFYDLCNPKLDENGDEKKGIKAGKIIKVMWNKVPHIKKFIEEEDIEDYSDKTFLQEYCCEFLDDAEDSLFNTDLIDGKFIDKDLTLYSLKEIEMPENPERPSEITSALIRKDIKERFDKIFIGYDPSISSAKDSDGSAVIAVGVKAEIWEIIFIRKLPKGMTQKDQCNYISRLALCLQADKVGFDSTGGMGLTFEERLKETPIKNKLVSVNFGGNFKGQEYTELKHKMEANKMKCPEHAEMRKQILNLGYNGLTGKIQAMGSWRTNKDDLPSAILCALACRNKKSKAAFTIL